MNVEWIKILESLASKGEPFAQVTLVNSRGNVPQEIGAKMLAGKAGLLHGTIGGGRVEAYALKWISEEFLEGTSNSKLIKLNLQRDIGMSCGGEVELFFERVSAPEWEFIIFGAGHVAQSLIRLLLTLDCKITCIDERKEWLDRLPKSDRLISIETNSIASEASRVKPHHFVGLMTQSHRVDFPILKEILSRPQPAYLGVIGSPVKAIILRKEVKEAGFSDELAKSFYCPMGLPIGTSSPAEIAISMAGQFLEVRDRLHKVKKISVNETPGLMPVRIVETEEQRTAEPNDP